MRTSGYGKVSKEALRLNSITAHAPLILNHFELMSNVNAFHEQYSFIHSESVFSTACVSCIVLDVQGNEMNETSSLPSKSSMRGKVYIYFS